MAVCGSAQFLASVVTRTRLWPLACWYCVMNCMHPRPPWGMGAPCWFTTSKKTAAVVAGPRAQKRHAAVPPRPISISDTVEASPRCFWSAGAEQAPIAPLILSSREHFT